MNKNQIISFLGDSITEGCGASKQENCYVNLVGEKLNCEVRNCGIAGTCITPDKEFYLTHLMSLDFHLRLPAIDSNSDMVFVFGGTNDYGHGRALMGEKDSRDIYTFRGAVRLLIEKLIDRFGKDKVFFITPCHRYSENEVGINLKEKLYLKDFVNAEIELLNEYDIKYIDLFNNWVDRPTTKQNSEYFADGLHPNDNGHKAIAEIICKFIKNLEK